MKFSKKLIESMKKPATEPVVNSDVSPLDLNKINQARNRLYAMGIYQQKPLINVNRDNLSRLMRVSDVNKAHVEALVRS